MTSQSPAVHRYARRGMARPGGAWSSTGWLAGPEVRALGTHAGIGAAGQGQDRLCMARHRFAGRGYAGPGQAWRGMEQKGRERHTSGFESWTRTHGTAVVGPGRARLGVRAAWQGQARRSTERDWQTPGFKSPARTPRGMAGHG